MAEDEHYIYEKRLPDIGNYDLEKSTMLLSAITLGCRLQKYWFLIKSATDRKLLLLTFVTS